MRPRVSLLTALASLAGLLASPAWAADPLKIGAILPMSGPEAPIAAETLKGLRFALEEAGNTIAGRPVELLVEDDQGKPNVGLTHARKLILSEKVAVLTGFVNSGVALAVRPLSLQNRLPMVISLSGANALTGENCSPWMFRLSYTNHQISEPFGPWLAKRGIRKVFLLAADYVTPRELVADFRKGFEAAGGQVVGEAYSPAGQTRDFGPYLSQARAASPDAILAVYYGADAIQFTKQYDSFGLKDRIKLVGTFGLNATMLRRAQGDSAAGIVAALNYIPELDTPENKAFQAAWQTKNNEPASEIAVMGYDSMRFIIAAVTGLGGRTDDKAALAAAMAKVSLTGPRGTLRIDPATNNIVQNTYMTESVKEGDRVVFRLLDTVREVVTPPNGCVMDRKE
jgi:branched-chain amino acid transport system substrate-binding protein